MLYARGGAWRGRQRAVFHEGAKALVELLPQGSYRTLEGQDHAFGLAPDIVAAGVVPQAVGVPRCGG